MNAYLIVKTLHILSATLMVGTGFGTAFYMFWRCKLILKNTKTRADGKIYIHQARAV